MFAYTNEDVARLNAGLRAVRKERGELGAVLILGRFTPERKRTLNALRAASPQLSLFDDFDAGAPPGAEFTALVGF